MGECEHLFEICPLHRSWHQETTGTEEVQSGEDQSESNEVRGQLGDLVSRGQTSQEEDQGEG